MILWHIRVFVRENAAEASTEVVKKVIQGWVNLMMIMLVCISTK